MKPIPPKHTIYNKAFHVSMYVDRRGGAIRYAVAVNATRGPQILICHIIYINTTLLLTPAPYHAFFLNHLSADIIYKCINSSHTTHARTHARMFIYAHIHSRKKKKNCAHCTTIKGCIISLIIS